jgi:hypothetical protein
MYGYGGAIDVPPILSTLIEEMTFNYYLELYTGQLDNERVKRSYVID